MCHHAHIRVVLAAEEEGVHKLAVIMVPVYASLLLAVIAVAVVTRGSRQGELIAARPASSATP